MLFSFQAESNGKDTAASPVCLDELDKLIQTLTLDPEEEPIAKVNLALFSSYNMVSSRISGVMVSMLALSVVDHGFESRSGQTIKLVFVTSLLSPQH